MLSRVGNDLYSFPEKNEALKNRFIGIWGCIKRIEGYYFECEAGILENCDWIQLKEICQHTHMNNGINDICALCGLDLRNEIHQRCIDNV